MELLHYTETLSTCGECEKQQSVVKFSSKVLFMYNTSKSMIKGSTRSIVLQKKTFQICKMTKHSSEVDSYNTCIINTLAY